MLQLWVPNRGAPYIRFALCESWVIAISSTSCLKSMSHFHRKLSEKHVSLPAKSTIHFYFRDVLVNFAFLSTIVSHVFHWHLKPNYPTLPTYQSITTWYASNKSPTLTLKFPTTKTNRSPSLNIRPMATVAEMRKFQHLSKRTRFWYRSRNHQYGRQHRSSMQSLG